jgi:hypothetical protein
VFIRRGRAGIDFHVSLVGLWTGELSLSPYCVLSVISFINLVSQTLGAFISFHVTFPSESEVRVDDSVGEKERKSVSKRKKTEPEKGFKINLLNKKRRKREGKSFQ